MRAFASHAHVTDVPSRGGQGQAYQRALANGGCGHEFNFNTGAPVGGGWPGAPANQRQVRFAPFDDQPLDLGEVST